MVARLARALGTAAGGTGVVTTATGAGRTFVVVTVVLVMKMPVVDVVHVIAMDDGGVTAAGPMGVAVGLRGGVLESRAHDNSSLLLCDSMSARSFHGAINRMTATTRPPPKR